MAEGCHQQLRVGSYLLGRAAAHRRPARPLAADQDEGGERANDSRAGSILAARGQAGELEIRAPLAARGLAFLTLPPRGPGRRSPARCRRGAFRLALHQHKSGDFLAEARDRRPEIAVFPAAPTPGAAGARGVRPSAPLRRVRDALARRGTLWGGRGMLWGGRLLARPAPRSRSLAAGLDGVAGLAALPVRPLRRRLPSASTQSTGSSASTRRAELDGRSAFRSPPRQSGLPGRRG